MHKSLGTFLLALGMALATVLVGVVGVPSPVAHADGGAPAVTRIMLAGDSITQGFDGDFTWRYRLYQELTRLQVPFDFVGPHNAPYGGSNTYLASGWDTDHDAKGGTTLAAQLQNITGDMQTYLPDVLVALYGTNDLRNGATPEQLIARWRAYVVLARAVRPQVTLVLGEVTSLHAPGRAEANAMLDDLATELSTTDSPVVVADLDSPAFDAARDTYDGTHPTPTGETLIAQRVAEALHLESVVPDAPDVARSYVPWTPPVRAVVHRVGARLTIDWARAKHRYRARHMRVRVVSVRTGRTVAAMTWSRHRTRLVTRALPRGSYRVVLQASRRTMTSVWGPAVECRVTRGR